MVHRISPWAEMVAQVVDLACEILFNAAFEGIVVGVGVVVGCGTADVPSKG